MENRTVTNRKQTVAKVKPIKKKVTTGLSNLNVSQTTNPSTGVPLLRGIVPPSQFTFARKLHAGEIHSTLIDRAAHVETLRKRISSLLQRAANVNSLGACGSAIRCDSTTTRQEVDETHGSHLAHLLSRLFESCQSKRNFQTVFQRTLAEIDMMLMEYIEEQLRNSRQRDEHHMEDLTLIFEQLLRLKKCTYQQEILELHDRINYLQDELSTSRKCKEMLEQQLASANSILEERSQEMGRAMEEITYLRNEVEHLRLYTKKHKFEMQDVHRLRHELNNQKRINKEILEEFLRIENERDEFCSELNNSLIRIRHSNLRRHQAMEAELNEVEENFAL